MNVLRLFLFVFTLFCSAQLYSQDAIKGVVKDAKGDPIGYATIVLMNDSIYLSGTTTNDKGMFELPDQDKEGNHLVVSMIGYEKLTVACANQRNLGTLVLKESSTELSEVVVKGFLPITQLKNGVFETTVENSVLAKKGTAEDVLANIPLVTVTDDNYEVWGKGAPLIFINGKQVRNLNELHRLNSKDIRTVSVNTNPGSKYPADVQAVILIKTIPAAGDGLSADISTEGRLAYFARNETDLSVNYRYDNLDLFAEGYLYAGKRRFQNSSEMITSAEQSLQQTINTATHTKFNDMEGKIGFNYTLSSKNSFGAYYNLGRDHTKARSNPTSLINQYSLGQIQSSEFVSTSLRSDAVSNPSYELSGYYSGEIGKFNINLNLDHTLEHTDKSNFYDEENITTPQASRSVSSKNTAKSKLFAQKLVVGHQLWKGDIEFGDEWTRSRLNYMNNYDGVSIDESESHIKENNTALFATISQTIGKFDLAAGFRYEHVDYKYTDMGDKTNDLVRHYDNVFPTFSVRTALGGVKLSLDLLNNITRPNYQQLDAGIIYVNNLTYQGGNPQLKPTKTYTAQLNGMWRWLFVQASVTKEKNPIFWKTSDYNGNPSIKMLSYDNGDSYTHYQLAIGGQPSCGFWSAQVTMALAGQRCSTLFLDEVHKMNRPIFSASLNNNFSLNGGWVIGANMLFTSRGDMQNTTVKSTNKLDLMVRKSFLHNNLSVAVYFNDILDGASSHATLYSGNIATTMFNRADRRNIRISLRYQFNAAESKYKGTGAGDSEKDRM